MSRRRTTISAANGVSGNYPCAAPVLEIADGHGHRASERFVLQKLEISADKSSALVCAAEDFLGRYQPGEFPLCLIVKGCPVSRGPSRGRWGSTRNLDVTLGR